MVVGYGYGCVPAVRVGDLYGFFHGCGVLGVAMVFQ